MSISPVLLLFLLAVLAALPGIFRKNVPPQLFLISALCALAAILTGLALDNTLEELIPPLLAVCAAAMAARNQDRGEGEP